MILPLANANGNMQVPWLACKPHSVRWGVLEFTPEGFILARTHLGDHLSGAAVACRLVQPTRNSNAAGRGSFLLGLAPDGGCLAAAITGGAVGSYL